MKRTPTLLDGIVAVGIIFIIACALSLCSAKDSLAWDGRYRIARACSGWAIMVISIILIFGLPWLFLKLLGKYFTRRYDE